MKGSGIQVLHEKRKTAHGTHIQSTYIATIKQDQAGVTYMHRQVHFHQGLCFRKNDACQTWVPTRFFISWKVKNSDITENKINAREMPNARDLQFHRDFTRL